ncbi:MAG: DUF1730 domain-containing protein [Bacteroidales bacterium]|jgi:epoxyqueuosine reductase|nr:DUF1730 domain-containing protein [Bacteroidales bacterium]
MEAKDIKQLAKSHGFSHCGIASSDTSFDIEQTYYQDVINKKGVGQMSYLCRNIESRFQATALLPECKSVIVCLYPYLTGVKPQHHYRFAKYSYLKDYHLLLKEKLGKMLQTLQEAGVVERGVVTVDSTPIVEKCWAVAAGVGLMGKNSLIHNDQGSYYLIGLLLTDAVFDYDTPLNGGVSDCGDCDLCVQTCPSCAINSPYRLDVCRCFSYYSTTKASLEEMTFDSEQRIFGCDLCQDICPKNKNSIINRDAIKHLHPFISYTDEQLNSITKEEFKTVFKNTVLERMNYEKWRALIAQTIINLPFH